MGERRVRKKMKVESFHRIPIHTPIGRSYRDDRAVACLVPRPVPSRSSRKEGPQSDTKHVRLVQRFTHQS
jgi:hypothetical protein